MQKLHPIAILLLFFILFSCGEKVETGKMNIENWKADRYGCKGLRIQDIEEFQKIKNSFLGANNQSIIKTFGRPDRVELLDKSQSFFFYFLEPSKGCESVKTEKEPLRVLFRMNAVNKVSEVNITTLNP